MRPEQGEKPRYDAGDPDQVKGRKERQKTRELHKRVALRNLMIDPGGRMLVWDLLGLCGVYRSSFSSEALLMAFNEGRRDIGNHLIAMISGLDGGPELYRLMCAEEEKLNG